MIDCLMRLTLLRGVLHLYWRVWKELEIDAYKTKDIHSYFRFFFFSTNIEQASVPGTVVDAGEAAADNKDKGGVGRCSWCFRGIKEARG